MPFFQKQLIFCPSCGKQYLGNPGHLFHTKECWDELAWKETLYIMGKEYYPYPKESSVEVSQIDSYD